MTTQTKYRKYDSESDYYAMGYRMYSVEFGRFLAVDPLFEAMPRHNPYHYSFNSPMFWSDPSGLVPVKEKVKNSEKLLMLQLPDLLFLGGLLLEMTNKEIANIYTDPQNDPSRIAERPIETIDGREGGGGGGSNGTTKATASYGLRFNKQGLIERVIEINRDNNVMQIKMGRMDKPDGISQFDFDQKMIDGFNDILEGNPNYFDPLFHSDSMINVCSGKMIQDIYNSEGGDADKPLAGLASNLGKGKGKFKYDIFIASELFTENHNMKYKGFGNFGEGPVTFQLWEAVAHEFGHAIDYRTVYDYNLYNSDMRENSVVKSLNNLRIYFNKPIELYK